MLREKKPLPPGLVQRDVNDQELKVGQRVCFTCGGSALQLGIIVKVGIPQWNQYPSSNINPDPRPYITYLNVTVKPLKSEKTRRVQLSTNILVLENLFETYL